MRRLLLLRHAKSDWPKGMLDIDRPRDGFLTVSQQPLLDVVRQLQAR